MEEKMKPESNNAEFEIAPPLSRETIFDFPECVPCDDGVGLIGIDFFGLEI